MRQELPPKRIRCQKVSAQTFVLVVPSLITSLVAFPITCSVPSSSAGSDTEAMADYQSGAQNNTGAPHESQSVAPPAHTVGEEFARQFYHVLTNLPHLAHRFYNDGSRMTHSGIMGAAVTVSGQKAINDKIMSMNLAGAIAEPASVDAQYSLQGGVTVLVTGRITYPGQEQKAFVQTFFLATQEKGYFVLNDTFRLLPELTKPYTSDFADASANGSPQQYAMQHEANGYGNIGRASSAGNQQNQAPPAHPTPTPPQPPVSAFQQANGHTSSAHTSQDLGAGRTSGDLARTPSPADSQGLPPPPPRPSAAPTQQAPSAPPQESAETEQPAEPPQQQGAEEKPSSDQPVARPAVDQNRPPVKSQRKPSTSAPQAAASEASAPVTTPSKTPMSYADLLRQKDSSAAQPVNRPQTPSQSSSAAPASTQAPTPSAATVALPQRSQGTRQQNRAPAASADSASPDQSAKENQPANQVQDRSSQGGTSRPPYSGSQGQGYRDDESSKKAVFVTNIPEETTTEELRELFGQFGAVKTGAGAVTLKKFSSNGKGPFAYLDFADVASAQAAIDASNVEFKGVELKIQAKRAQNVYGGRGRGGPYGMRGGYSRGRGNDRGFAGRGSAPSSGSSAPDVQADGSADRGQGGRPSGRGGQSGGRTELRGRGGRDGGRGRGRGPPRQPSVQGTELPSAPQAVTAE